MEGRRRRSREFEKGETHFSRAARYVTESGGSSSDTGAKGNVGTLAYSGTRFRQLQEWQKQVFDSTLCGGIKGRNMADISVGLRVDIDEAQAEHDPIVGIKLDQSKCFDRIVPSFAGALFLVFGMPKGVVGMFLKLYQGLK